MSIGLKRIIIIALGILAGAAAWPLMELVLSFQSLFPGYFIFSIVQGALFGLVLGLFFGSGEGLTSRNGKKLGHGLASGAAVGVIGGVVGFLFGQGVLFFILDKTSNYLAVPVARGIGWALLGLFVGAVDGIRVRSLRKTAIGALGGIIGGAAGGAAIELIRLHFSELLMIRAVGFILFGLLVGIGYAVAERSFSFGILHVLNGPQRGREYSLSQSSFFVGTSSSNDISAEGYHDIEPRHIRFYSKRKELYIKDISGKAGTKVNEEPLRGERLLKYEDVIQVGSLKICYLTE
ncbi:FHA domain-containing protein [Sediminispirochaeta smaragdinae]|uniref:FHA domain containing protein n=1 Tax=Sediminispirochaeta smaragdinae (strain DSM 11293 / JCM 15392 / SEBR 4228) TaxID=573413 RepID=E1R8B2_SEDSS|nr:FHA domain-containing protein [Sediminispirochaeta smaragdinae]ADK79256.1 FHA domain containing protein [Sediminispirochaeta smaragdinae DSM 11293]